MNNYNTDNFNLLQETLKNIKLTKPNKIDGCNTLLIKADTIMKITYTCDKCHSIHNHTIKEYKQVFTKYMILEIL